MTLLDFAKSHGVKHIFLDTPAAAKQSHIFYEKADFRKIDISELPVEYSFPDSDSAIYILDI